MADIFNFYVRDDRKIDFHSPEPIMQEDKDVAVWKFRIPKVLNQIDMSNWAWWFVYVNAKGQKFSKELMIGPDYDEPGVYNSAEISIDHGISIYPGNITFALEAIEAVAGGGEIISEWHTYTYTHKVIGTLQGNQAEYAETQSDIISALIVQIQQKYNALAGGATPQVVTAISSMTDTSKIYVLSTDGNWYYHNGSAWVSGGVYASGVTIDPTLSQSGQAADAKVVGDNMFSAVYSRATVISNGTDYDTLKTPGNYRVTSTANANTMLHCPAAMAHRLFVFSGTDSEKVFQLAFINVRTNEKLALRSYVNASLGWSEWIKFTSMVDVNAAITDALNPYLVKDVIPMIATPTQTHSGITFTQNSDKTWTISGTLTASYAQQNIYYNQATLPDWIVPGRYKVRLLGATKGIYLFGAEYYASGNTVLFQTEESYDGIYSFELSKDAVGFALYFRVTQSLTDPITVRPILFSAEAFDNAHDIVQENIDVEPYIIQNKCVRPASHYSDVPVVTFTHFSDIHTKLDLWNRVAEYTNYYKQYIDFAMFTGDYYNDNHSSAVVDLVGLGTPFNIPLYMTIGNHDTYANANHEKLDQSVPYEEIFVGSSRNNAVFMSGDYSMTYYVDFPNSNLRIIALDNYYNLDEQVTWLAGVLASAKTNGYSVATFMHEPTAKITVPVDCTFQTMDNDSNEWATRVFDAPIAEFISNGGNFVANFCGHHHRNYIGYTASGVLNIVIPAATIFARYNDDARVANTRTYDCFDVVGIDTNTSLIKITRIGNNVDHYMRSKKALCYNYNTNTVVFNN